MAIHTQQANIVEGGFAKELDEGSRRLILDNLQKTQYSYPEKSTIRELTSNGIDAIRERDVAISILTGQSSVEEHYVKIEGDEYKDSYFDHTYYDPQWLSDDKNVYITYKEGSMLEKDKLIIRDNGVGLWSNRLVGYFKLAWSSKRLSRFGLGKFGIGAKAALSTGAPYYTVVNRYNGREMRFNVYPYQVEPIVPKLNMETGQENPSILLNNGVQCYYLPTKEKNGLEIILESKKHHKQRYVDAVKSQLLYFDNIVFKIETHDGRVDTVEVSAKILYEDDIMILSDNTLYSKPHVLINKVNYGNIDFQELELEDKIGNISIKMKPEEVSVSPSREHVLWDDMTREAIIKRFKEVQAVSEGLLQKELNQADFIKWLKACITVKNKINTEQSSSLVSRLARLVNLNDYVPVYKPDPQFKLDRDLFAGIKVRKIFYKNERHGSNHKTVIAREDVWLTDLIKGDLPIVVQRENTMSLRDAYLLDTLFMDGFITIWLNDTEPKQPEKTEDMTEEEFDKICQSYKTALFNQAKATAFELKLIKPMNEDEVTPGYAKAREVAIEQVLARWRAFNKYILEAEGIQLYESFEVPESYKDAQKNKSDGEKTEGKVEAEIQTQEAKLSAEARRKLQGKTILFTPQVRHNWYGDKDWLYTWDKMEIPVAEIDEWKNPEVFYSSDDNASLLQLAAFITRPDDKQLSTPVEWEEEETVYSSYQASGAPNFTIETKAKTSYRTAFDGNVDVKLIKVAKDRVKYYQDFKHIQKFFAEIKNKTLIMSNSLVRWNTARYIHDQLPKLAFLNNFRQFSEEHYNAYHQLLSYSNKYYREVKKYTGKYKEINAEEYDDMVNHLDKVAELQVFVAEHKDDPEAIASVVKELFGTGAVNTVTDGCALDMNLRDMLHKLLDYAEPLSCMLNQMPILTGETQYDEEGEVKSNSVIKEELETEIRNFIQFKQAGM